MQIKSTILVLIFLISTVEIKSSPILINNESKLIQTSTESEFFIDTLNEHNFQSILKTPTIKWEKSGGTILNFGPKGFPVWVKFQIQFSENAKGVQYIRYDFPTIDQLDFYELDNQGNVISQLNTGDAFSFSNRGIPSHIFLFPIESEPNTTRTILIRTQTSASLSIPIFIQDFKNLYSEDTLVYMFFGIYFGLIMAMIVNNLSVYLYTKDFSYILYIIYVATYFMLIFSGFGFGYRLFYPDSTYIQSRIFITSAALNSVMSIYFSIHFLKLKNVFPYMTKFLHFWAIITILWLIIFIISNDQYYYIFTAIITGVPIFIIFVMALTMCRKSIYAIYFVLAWVVYLVFYASSILRLTGFLPSNFFTYYGIQIGSGLQLLLLSLSIGHKTYEIRKKGESLYFENLALKDSANKELASQVVERAKELNSYVKGVQADIEMARSIQLNTLPKEIDWSDSRLDLATLFLPKDRVSGDIFDVFKIDEDRFRFFIADATGHGIQAAFLTMSIQTEYQRVKSQFSDPAQVLRLLNSSLFKTFGKETTLYSCCVIDIDLAQKFLIYSSAGHPNQYLIQNGEMIELNSLSTLIGFHKDVVMKSKSIQLKDRFKVILLSDGVIEATNGSLEEYGEVQLKSVIMNDPLIASSDLNLEIFQSINSHTKDHFYEDDITLIIADFKL
jgi:serine phosphatase RsbU (regulator of sigma subunit)